MTPARRSWFFASTALVAGCVAMLAAPGVRGGDAAAPADRDGWKALFDGKSLDGWKPGDFFGPGKVHVQAGELVMEKGKTMTGITYSRGDFPKVDYEVTLEGRKIDGEDFFCTTTFPVADSFCSLVVGGWGGGVVGLSSVNGADASENETNKSMKFEKGRWYRVRIRVTAGKIEAWIDKDKMVDLELDGRRISTRIECRPCQPFGIAAWKTTAAVRDLRVRTLTDKEKQEIGGKKKE